jgi:chromate transporter
MAQAWEVFRVFLRLGLTSFGGPSAHIAYFREEFVNRRKWLDEDTFASTLALCQFLPGPASSQFGLAVGHMRAGLPGALAAWLGFTLPSAALMIGFGLGMLNYAPKADPGWLQGLRVAVVVVVAKAVWGMARTLCPGRIHLTLAFLSAIAVLAGSAAWTQVTVIAVGAVMGCLLFSRSIECKDEAVAVSENSRHSWVWLSLFGFLLLGTPFVAKLIRWAPLDFAYGFYRSGALVFGGGHVVLPLLRDLVVPQGWMTDGTFMAGYGAAQALPGPLFTIAAYLGTISAGPVRGIAGGLVALLAIFLPGWLLVLGVLPHWRRRSQSRLARAALQGTNSSVVGLLVAALYHPVWTSGMLGPRHMILGLSLFLLMAVWDLPPWAGVLMAAGMGALMLR